MSKKTAQGPEPTDQPQIQQFEPTMKGRPNPLLEEEGIEEEQVKPKPKKKVRRKGVQVGVDVATENAGKPKASASREARIMNKKALAAELIPVADELDARGDKELANEIDALIAEAAGEVEEIVERADESDEKYANVSEVLLKISDALDGSGEVGTSDALFSIAMMFTNESQGTPYMDANLLGISENEKVKENLLAIADSMDKGGENVVADIIGGAMTKSAQVYGRYGQAPSPYGYTRDPIASPETGLWKPFPGENRQSYIQRLMANKNQKKLAEKYYGTWFSPWKKEIGRSYDAFGGFQDASLQPQQGGMMGWPQQGGMMGWPQQGGMNNNPVALYQHIQGLEQQLNMAKAMFQQQTGVDYGSFSNQGAATGGGAISSPRTHRPFVKLEGRSPSEGTEAARELRSPRDDGENLSKVNRGRDIAAIDAKINAAREKNPNDPYIKTLQEHKADLLRKGGGSLIGRSDKYESAYGLTPGLI